jgi:polyferredoxin
MLRLPVLGALLRLPRPVFQWPLFLVAMAMVAHGFFGPELAPKNLATTLSWVHYRGILVLVLLAAGNLFCLACPFMLVRNFARRFFKPFRAWPRALRNKWLSLILFAGVLFAYELFDLWGSPLLTACLILGYFGAALAVDAVFKKGSFCKYVCPIGQFYFVASSLSPLEVRVREPSRFLDCKTHDCIRVTRSPDEPCRVVIIGCELALLLPRKV